MPNASAPRIVCVACWNVDLTMRVPHLPAPGETLLATGFTTGPGGKGCNAAVAAARLGGAVSLVARLGDDDHGRSGPPFWQGEGINSSHCRTAVGEPNAVAQILVADGGENCISVFRGAGFALRSDDVHAAEPAFVRARVVGMPLEIQDEAVFAALQIARRHGATTVLNPAPARSLPDTWWPLIDVLTPNALEARQLCGLSPDAPATLPELGAALLARGCGSVVMTDGAHGAWVFERDQPPLHVPPFTVMTVDTVGAGDAFNGALMVALGEGRPLAQAALFANAAAALSTTMHGAAAAMPRRHEVDALAALQLPSTP
jgi:ribokinase